MSGKQSSPPPQKKKITHKYTNIGHTYLYRSALSPKPPAGTHQRQFEYTSPRPATVCKHSTTDHVLLQSARLNSDTILHTDGLRHLGKPARGWQSAVLRQISLPETRANVRQVRDDVCLQACVAR